MCIRDSVITIYGRENATVYLREMQTSYVIADGKVTITVPDYMWYDTESSTFATAVETDTMDISITPYILSLIHISEDSSSCSSSSPASEAAASSSASSCAGAGTS